MSLPAQVDAYIAALVQELSSGLAVRLGQADAAPSSASPTGEGWCLSAALVGPVPARLSLWMDLGGAERLVRSLTGVETPTAPAVISLLRELWLQAAATVRTRAEFTDWSLAVDSVDIVAASGEPDVFELRTGDITIRLAVAADSHIRPSGSAGVAGTTAASDLLLDIDLPLTVRFARTTMTIRDLLTIGAGSVVDMGRSPDEPVQVLVGDHVIAHGEVVVVGGHYGVRITGVASPGDRMRGLEA